MTTSIEFHDSTLVTVNDAGTDVEAVLDAYVHRWDTLGEAWTGTGWMQPVRIHIADRGDRSVAPTGLPIGISDGWLRVGFITHNNMVPLPFTGVEAVVLWLQLESADVLEFTGAGVRIDAIGDARYVEDLPADMRPGQAVAAASVAGGSEPAISEQPRATAGNARQADRGASMSTISLPFLVVYSLFISAVLIWLNRRGAGSGVAAAGTLAVCVAVSLLCVALGPARLSRQTIQSLLVFVFIPTAFVFAASRFGVFQTRPWWLLFVGPLSFVMAVIVVTVAYNVLFASARSH